MTNLTVAAFAGGVVLAAIVAVAVVWFRDRYASDGRNRISGYRDVYEPLFADLWSNEMHRRLTALFVAQRIARSPSAARGLANVLISFIRRRLASAERSAQERESFEDVRLALAILGTKVLRQAQVASGQAIDLSGVNFCGAALYGANLEGFRLVQCKFDGCQLVSAKLQRAELAGSSFIGANLSRADLRGADFSEADLSEADFTRARISSARLASANIGGTILTDAVGLTQEQLDQAFGDAGTAVPERFRLVPVRSQYAKRPPRSPAAGGDGVEPERA